MYDICLIILIYIATQFLFLEESEILTKILYRKKNWYLLNDIFSIYNVT